VKGHRRIQALWVGACLLDLPSRAHVADRVPVGKAIDKATTFVPNTASPEDGTSTGTLSLFSRPKVSL